MMSAMVPSGKQASRATGSSDEQASCSNEQPEDTSEREKTKLVDELLAAAKQCHKRFGGKAELATESEACVRDLCLAFERIFGHGLQQRAESSELAAALRHVSDLVRSGPSSSRDCHNFWTCVKEQLTWHERERFDVLRKVQTDQGRGRAWLRAALNERSLENHLVAIVASAPAALQPYYKPSAFLLDQDKSSILPNVAAGLCRQFGF